MKRNTLAGVILIVLGVIWLSYHGIRYTTREKAVDIGPIQVTTERTRTIPFPPLLGGLAVIVGVVLIVRDNRKMLA